MRIQRVYVSAAPLACAIVACTLCHIEMATNKRPYIYKNGYNYQWIKFQARVYAHSFGIMPTRELYLARSLPHFATLYFAQFNAFN